ncbi:aldo/keto reductase [Kribbella deserti]|uniref:Aldo/keto reductase n=1 Tax=Kribbella deserti TaxID=1926257 RepID=A0ABV6QWY1_9ACTN
MTGLNLALGAMEFGSRIDEKASFALLDQYVDAGGEWIDTANCYAFWQNPSGHGGQSEELLGRWIAQRPGVRDRIKLATKVGCEPLHPGGYPAHVESLDQAGIDAALSTSLRRLGVDHVDLYWAHRDDRATPLEETIGTFGRHVAAGTVGHIGLSNWALWRTERARAVAVGLGVEAPSYLQLQYSYVRPRPLVADRTGGHRFGWLTDETIDYATTDPNWNLWAYTPLMSGAYDRDDKSFPQEYDHPGTTARVETLAKVAAELGVSRSSVVVAWLVGGTPAVRPIVGASRPEQLAASLEGARLDLPGDVRAELDKPW